jgi:hypothetical protein
MATQDAVWKALSKERKFQRIAHCTVSGADAASDLRWHYEKNRKWAEQSVDYFGRRINKGSNVLEFPVSQFKTLAKHLQVDPCSRSGLSTFIFSILNQANEMMKTGQVHPNLEVKRLIPSDPCYDAHKSQQAQYGCFATGDIGAGTVLVQYVGELKIDRGSRPIRELDSNGEQSKEDLDAESQELHSEDYAFSTGQESDESKAELYIDSGSRGNEATFINDGRDASMINARYVRVLVNGISAIFCIAMQAIKQGEQVLAKYGKTYWDARTDHQRRRAEFACDPVDLEKQTRIQQQKRRTRPKPCGFYKEAKVRDRLPSAIEFMDLCSKVSSHNVCPFVFNLDRLSGGKRTDTPAVTLPQFCGDIQPLKDPGSYKAVRTTEASSEGSDDSDKRPSASERTPKGKAPKAQGKGAAGRKRPAASPDGAGGSPAKVARHDPPAAIAEDLDPLTALKDLLRAATPDARLSSAARLAAALERVHRDMSHYWRLALAAGCPQRTAALESVRRCVDRLRRPERVSVVLLGDTGVGKSFLANLLALLSAPPEDAYGARLLLSPDRLDWLRAHVESGRPLEGDVLESSLVLLEAWGELCAEWKTEPKELVAALARRPVRPAARAAHGAGAAHGSGAAHGAALLDVRSFVQPTAEEVEDEEEDMRSLLRACKEVRSTRPVSCRGKVSMKARQSTNKHTRARTHARTHARKQARTHARKQARTHARTNMRTHARTHACTHATRHAHARKHAGACVCLCAHQSMKTKACFL